MGKLFDLLNTPSYNVSRAIEMTRKTPAISASHEVSPKEDAVQCGECHMGGKRMDWKELGYKGDPMKIGGRVVKK